MNVIETRLPGVLVIEPRIFRDDRGYFLETWSAANYGAGGLPTVFAQDNLSCSSVGVLRGLHYQFPTGQGKLVSVSQENEQGIITEGTNESFHEIQVNHRAFINDQDSLGEAIIMMVLESAGAVRVSEQSMERLRLGQVDQVFIDLRRMADSFTTRVDCVAHTVGCFSGGCGEGNLFAGETQTAHHSQDGEDDRRLTGSRAAADPSGPAVGSLYDLALEWVKEDLPAGEIPGQDRMQRGVIGGD